MSGFCESKPKINYPCPWLFKVIGADREKVKAAIIKIVEGHQHSLVYGNASSSGKYHSFNLELVVESESHRDHLYRTLGACAVIKVVL